MRDDRWCCCGAGIECVDAGATGGKLAVDIAPIGRPAAHPREALRDLSKSRISKVEEPYAPVLEKRAPAQRELAPVGRISRAGNNAPDRGSRRTEWCRRLQAQHGVTGEDCFFPGF